MRRSLLAASALAVMSLLTGPAGAATLADLVSGGGSLTFGDKTFSGFSNAKVICIGTCGVGDTTAGVTVTAGSYNGLIGLDFTEGFSIGTSTSFDLKFEYDVTATAPLITDFHLDMDGTLNPANGNINVNVTETAYNGTTNVGQLTVFDVPTLTLTAGANFSPAGPYKTIHLVKDISLATDATTTANLSDFKQTFSQVAVPEPSSILLLVSVLGGVGFLARRSKFRLL